MKLSEEKLSSEKVFGGRIFDVCVDIVALPDGGRAVRECVRHPGGAAVLFVRDGNIALVKQFRYLYGEELYEIPAGKLDAGEDPRSAALRELEEETGYRAAECKHIMDIYPTPGYTDEVIHIYCVESARFVGQNLDEGEFLGVEFVPADEVAAMIFRGEIKDSKTICAVLAHFFGKTLPKKA